MNTDKSTTKCHICLHTWKQGGLMCGIWNWQSTIVKDLNNSQDPKHTLFCRENAFVAIYALFSDNKCPLFTCLGGGSPKADIVHFFYRFSHRKASLRLNIWFLRILNDIWEDIMSTCSTSSSSPRMSPLQVSIPSSMAAAAASMMRPEVPLLLKTLKASLRGAGGPPSQAGGPSSQMSS